MQIILNLATLNGPTLLAMVATVARNDTQPVVILTGREMDSGLAGLLHNSSGSAMETIDADTRLQLDRGGSDEISSLTLPSDLRGHLDRGGNEISSLTLPSDLRGQLDRGGSETNSFTLSSDLREHLDRGGSETSSFTLPSDLRAQLDRGGSETSSITLSSTTMSNLLVRGRGGQGSLESRSFDE